MSIKIYLAQRAERKLSKQARQERRAFRDYRRNELRTIRSAEIRARGLRLFIAWSDRGSKETGWSINPVWQSQVAQVA